MKRLLVLLMLTALILVGCQGAQAPAPEKENPDPQVTMNELAPNVEEPVQTGYEYGTPITVDNVVFTINGCEINPVKGDRTEDNYADDNGEYFAIGSDIVKAAEYEQIEFSVIIENKSNKAIYFSEAGWVAKLPDGYMLEPIEADGKIAGQMPSNYKAEGKVIIIKEKVIQADQLQLTYNLMDYNEEWQEAIWKAMSGELTAEEYTAKFNPQPVIFDIKL